MILDTLDNWNLHATPGTRLAVAFDYLLRFDPTTPDGLVEVDGMDLYALVMNFDTLSDSEGRFEAHRNYLDIQLNILGGESMGWAPTPSLTVNMPYDPARDLMFLHTPEKWTRLRVVPGSFALFHPADAHMPNLHLDAPGKARKVVMKVRL